MPVFTPPTTDGVQIADPARSETDGAHALWRFYDTWAMGQTVWKDALGAWHQTIYPYQGGEVDRVFRKGVLISETTDSSVLSLANAQVVYEGGHEYTITEAEATELTAAGFGAGVDLQHALIVNNAVGAYASTPPHADFLGYNEIDVQIYAEGLANFQPLFLSNHLIGTDGEGFVFSVHPNSRPRTVIHQASGGSGAAEEALAPFHFPTNTPFGVRCRAVLDDSAGRHRWEFFQSPDGTSWEMVDRTEYTPAILSSLASSPLTVPGSAGALPWLNKVYWAKLTLDGQDVALPDFRQLAAGTTQFTDSVGKVWTLTGPATIG